MNKNFSPSKKTPSDFKYFLCFLVQLYLIFNDTFYEPAE